MKYTLDFKERQRYSDNKRNFKKLLAKHNLKWKRLSETDYTKGVWTDGETEVTPNFTPKCAYIMLDTDDEDMIKEFKDWCLAAKGNRVHMIPYKEEPKRPPLQAKLDKEKKERARFAPDFVKMRKDDAPEEYIDALKNDLVLQDKFTREELDEIDKKQQERDKET